MKTCVDIFSKVVKLSVILLTVVFIENGTNHFEVQTKNENLNKTLDLATMAEKVKVENAQTLEQTEIIAGVVEPNIEQTYIPQVSASYDAVDTYVGNITGYSAYCYGCGGYLPGLGVNARETGIYYTDSEYGTVRIVAASTYLPFGSIVKFNLPSVSSEPIVAIVADRGGAVQGTKLDLLVETDAYAIQYVGNQSIIYDVLRLGW